MNPQDPPGAPHDHVPDFSRTISRGLVHRAVLEEVFLTDFRSLTPDHFRAGGRLPRHHPYYTDDFMQPKQHDPLAVFECVRQALLCALHVHHRVSQDGKAVTASTGMRIADPDVLVVRPGSHEVRLDGYVEMEKEREGALSRVVHRVEAWSWDRLIGEVTVDTAVMPSEAYAKFRMKNRSTPPPKCSQLVDREERSRLPAALVGRQDADNVLLQTVQTEGVSASARMRVPFSHTSLFDHCQDHLPGTALMEAARQLSLLLAGEVFGRSPAKTMAASVDAKYYRFAELDSDLMIEARYTEPEPGSFTEPITVSFRQEGADVTDMTLRLTGTEHNAEPFAAGLVGAGRREV